MLLLLSAIAGLLRNFKYICAKSFKLLIRWLINQKLVYINNFSYHEQLNIVSGIETYKLKIFHLFDWLLNFMLSLLTIQIRNNNDFEIMRQWYGW